VGEVRLDGRPPDGATADPFAEHAGRAGRGETTPRGIVWSTGLLTAVGEPCNNGGRATMRGSGISGATKLRMLRRASGAFFVFWGD